MRIVQAAEQDVATVRELFLEYRAAVDAEICFSSFEQELARLPNGYDAILLATVDSQTMGCIALRPLCDGTCEIKRLYVRTAGQGHGLGRKLVEQAIEAARGRGYRRLVLDTLPGMEQAIALYRAMGFTPIERYNTNPDSSALFFEKQL